MHRNLSKHASRVQRSVPYYLIFILILSGALDLFIFSFFSLEKNHFFKRVVLASDFEKHPFVVRNREPIRPQKGATASLMVAATSDMHGSLGILCVINCNEVKGLLHLAPLIQKLREENPQMLLLDGGDTFQGGILQFYINHVQVSAPWHDPLLHTMNFLKYDAMTLGNHDLEMSQEKLIWRMKESSFPWLGANVQQDPEDSNHSLRLDPYKVLERNGIRIGILGMTTPGIPIWLDSPKLKGFSFQDILSSSRKWISVLKNQEKVDLLIGLYHSGGDMDYDEKIALKLGWDTPNASGQVAKLLREFDLLIAGHTHQTIPNRPQAELPRFPVPMIFPGAYARGLSVVKIQLKESGGRWQIKNMNFDYIKPTAPSKESGLLRMNRFSNQLIETVKSYASQPTQVILKEKPERNTRNQCLNNLNHISLQDSDKTQKFSLLPGNWHPAGFKVEDLGKPILRKHLFQWMRYDNRAVLAKLFGKQIRTILNPLLRKLQGRKIRYNQYLVPGGFKAVPDNEDKPEDLFLMKLDGSPIKENEFYQVWMTNYHWNGGADVRSRALLHDSQLLRRDSRFLRERVFDFLKQDQPQLPKSCLKFLEPLKKPNLISGQ